MVKRTINIAGNNSYNMMKYNAVIMLKEILKHSSKYLNDDVNICEVVLYMVLSAINFYRIIVYQ